MSGLLLIIPKILSFFLAEASALSICRPDSLNFSFSHRPATEILNKYRIKDYFCKNKKQMKFRILIISLIAAIAVQYPAFSQEAEISEDKVYELMFTDYDAACRMMESLREEADLPDW